MSDGADISGAACGDAGKGLPADPAPSPVAGAAGFDSLAEQRLARLRSFRAPRVDEIEEMNALEEYLKWKHGGGPSRREAKRLEPLREN